MEDLSRYHVMIEEIISELGVDPAITRGDIPGSWRVHRGSAQVLIDIWHLPKEKRGYFQVMCPIMRVPEARKFELYQELLESNDKLFGVAFSLYKDTVWLKTIREVTGLDKSEASAMITRVGNYADRYDDELIQKYYPGSDPLPGDIPSPASPGKT